MHRIIFIWLITSALVVSAPAQDTKIFDSFIQRALQATPMVPGIGVAVVKNGEVVMAQGYGYADIEAGLKANGETSYYIASVTKSFTGLLALLLADEGLIDLDAPLTTYKPFGQLKNKDVFAKITIRELLNHTSGIENDYIVFREAYTGDKSLEIMTMLLEEKTTLRKEGKTYRYDNLGYNIFGILLEAEFGKKWQDLLQEKVFSPLKMTRTSAYISRGEKKNWPMAWPYEGIVSMDPRRSALMKNDDMMQAAGGLICSPKDAANWIITYLNKGQLNGKQVIKPSIIEAALQPTATSAREGDIFNDTGYGAGWITAQFGEQKVNYHFGGFVGFFSHISIMPEKNIGIAVFANENAFGDNVSNLIAAFIYDYYLGNVDAVDDYEDKIQALKQRIADVQKNMQNHYAKIAAREWKLELTKGAYAGTYFNKYVGTVEILEGSDELHVTMGSMKAVATPFTEPNSIRVEFAGNGNAMQFEVKDGRVTTLNFEGDIFERVK